eukprot:7403162-Pyramimonas_sp.AAC.1
MQPWPSEMHNLPSDLQGKSAELLRRRRCFSDGGALPVTLPLSRQGLPPSRRAPTVPQQKQALVAPRGFLVTNCFRNCQRCATPRGPNQRPPPTRNFYPELPNTEVLSAWAGRDAPPASQSL